MEPVHQQELRDEQQQVGHRQTGKEDVEDHLLQREPVAGKGESGERRER